MTLLIIYQNKEKEIIFKEKEIELGRPITEKEKEKILLEQEIVEPREEKENLPGKAVNGLWGTIRDGVKNLWWASVKGVKWLADKSGRGLKFAYINVSSGGRSMAQAVVGINLYGWLAEKAEETGAKLAYATHTSRSLMADKTQPLIKKIEITAGFLSSVWFDKEPTRIANVHVEEVGRDYAVVVWETNHWATSKVNWG
jgi:hypothetical protein